MADENNDDDKSVEEVVEEMAEDVLETEDEVEDGGADGAEASDDDDSNDSSVDSEDEGGEEDSDAAEEDDGAGASEIAEEAEASEDDSDDSSVDSEGEEDSGAAEEGDEAGESDASDETETSDSSDETGEDEGGDQASEKDVDGESEGSDDTSELVDKIAESDQLDGVSKDEITDALAEVASEAEDDQLADAVASLAGEDDESTEESEEDSEVEEDREEVEDGDRDQESDEEESETEIRDESGEEEEEIDTEESTEEEAETEEEEAETEEEQPDRTGEGDDDRIGGVFTPEKYRKGEADEGFEPEGEAELESEESQTGVLWAGGISVVALAIALVYLFGFSKQGERLVHLFKGDLKEYELAQSKKKQAELREKQRKVIDDTPKIGTLKLRGKPQYSLIKVDGQVQYGKPEGSDYWKRMRLTPKTSFPVFRVEKDHEVTIEAPGRQSRIVKLGKGNWTPVDSSVPDLQDAALKYRNEIYVTLVPESRASELEFHKRMEKDPENNYFGKVTIESKPEGAKIIFNGAPLQDKDGNELTTPVTFEKYYYKPEDADELTEKKVKVDKPPDKGHKIQLQVPEAEGDYPKFVSGLQRQMWTCNWKDGEVPDNPHPKHCNYTYKLSVDFDEVKSFIENREKQRKEIKDAWDEAQNEIDAIVEEANRKAGTKSKKKKRKAVGNSKSGGKKGK